jgi:glycosyltransferase involved in cell wall biosynthesis
MRSVLMVSEKFPPHNVSGSARPFYFAKYLPEFGYLPHVLASTALRSDDRDATLLEELPAVVHVQRTPRLLSPLVGRLRTRGKAVSAGPTGGKKRSGTGPGKPFLEAFQGLGWWSHWELDWSALATLAGWLGARRSSPELIWGSGPHFRNFAVAYRLSLWLDKPLVVDLRDPWTYGSLWNPKTAAIARAEQAWAARVLGRAARVVFTSPLTLEAMHERFPALDRRRLVVLTNGFDETEVTPRRDLPDDRCLFRYVGMLNERRHPDPLILAFARACEDAAFKNGATLEFIGNAGGHATKAALAPGADVRFLGHVSRAESLRYMFGSDVNVLLQTIRFGQDVVSGKAFDYLHAHKPILAVVDPEGGDAWLVRETASGKVAPFDDVEAIAREMKELWRATRTVQTAPRPMDLGAYSRRGITRRLAALFDEVLLEQA